MSTDSKTLIEWLKECGICHAVVFEDNLAAHAFWHEELAKVARAADWGALWTRPIGPGRGV